jgi:hypothetical protein
MVHNLERPPGTTMSPDVWDSTWDRAIGRRLAYLDDAEARGMARVERRVLVAEQQLWGSVIWRSSADADQLAVDHLVIADPARPVRMTHRMARAAVRDPEAPTSRVPALGAGLVGGLLTAGQVDLPGLLDLTVVAAGGAAALGVRELLTNRGGRHCRVLTGVEHGDTLGLVTGIGVRLQASAELAASVLDELRDILWAADHAHRGHTAARIEGLHAAVAAILPDPHDHLARRRFDSDREQSPRQIKKQHAAAVAREQQHLNGEYLDGRLDALTEWLSESAAQGRRDPSTSHCSTTADVDDRGPSAEGAAS